MGLFSKEGNSKPGGLSWTIGSSPAMPNPSAGNQQTLSSLWSGQSNDQQQPSGFSQQASSNIFNQGSTSSIFGSSSTLGQPTQRTLFGQQSSVPNFGQQNTSSSGFQLGKTPTFGVQSGSSFNSQAQQPGNAGTSGFGNSGINLFGVQKSVAQTSPLEWQQQQIQKSAPHQTPCRDYFSIEAKLIIQNQSTEFSSFVKEKTINEKAMKNVENKTLSRILLELTQTVEQSESSFDRLFAEVDKNDFFDRKITSVNQDCVASIKVMKNNHESFEEKRNSQSYLFEGATSAIENLRKEVQPLFESFVESAQMFLVRTDSSSSSSTLTEDNRVNAYLDGQAIAHKRRWTFYESFEMLLEEVHSFSLRISNLSRVDAENNSGTLALLSASIENTFRALTSIWKSVVSIGTANDVPSHQQRQPNEILL